MMRHNRALLRVYQQYGELNEVDDRKRPGDCAHCLAPLHEAGPAKRNRCRCPHCGHTNQYPRPAGGPPRHRLFAIEYHNPARKAHHRGRFFKKPDARDLARAADATARFARLEPGFIPDQEIPPGDETDRLHRWGYSRYRDLFNPRQLLALELACRHIATVGEVRLRHALTTNLSDLPRYQNMLCRHDTMALKSLDIFSVHGFPVGLVQCESNVLGIRNGNGIGVGSGGWVNIIDKYTKAKRYRDAPFEIRHKGSRKARVPITGEWIGEPMDFCCVWLRRLVDSEAEGLERESTRPPHELTGNLTRDRHLGHFAAGLADVYTRMAHALKPGAPLTFTYHHNRIEAYYAVGVAILDAGLVCSASLPCQAEMSGSIHIHGTGSTCSTRGPSSRPAGRAPLCPKTGSYFLASP